MENNTLYVGNLSYNADEQDLDIAFSAYGSVDDIQLMRDRESGRSRGFAFILYSSSDEAHAALAMDGLDIDGRPVRVSFAKEKAVHSRKKT